MVAVVVRSGGSNTVVVVIDSSSSLNRIFPGDEKPVNESTSFNDEGLGQ